VYTEKDEVIDVESIKEAYRQYGASHKRLVNFTSAWRHNLASDILAPKNVKTMTRLLVDFSKSVR